MVAAVSRTYAEAEALAATLIAAGVPATPDVANVAASLPCVLIAPPRITGQAAGGDWLVTWRLVVIAASAIGSSVAWEQLDDLLEKVFDALPVDTADPGAWQAPMGGDPLPCYFVTITGSA